MRMDAALLPHHPLHYLLLYSFCEKMVRMDAAVLLLHPLLLQVYSCVELLGVYCCADPEVLQLLLLVLGRHHEEATKAGPAVLEEMMAKVGGCGCVERGGGVWLTQPQRKGAVPQRCML